MLNFKFISIKVVNYVLNSDAKIFLPLLVMINK